MTETPSQPAAPWRTSSSRSTAAAWPDELPGAADHRRGPRARRAARSSPTGRSATSPAAPGPRARRGRTSRRSGAGEIVPRMLRDVADARPVARRCSAPRCRRRCCSRRSACSRSSTPTASWRSRARRPRSGVPTIAQHRRRRTRSSRSPRRRATAPRWFQLYWPKERRAGRELRPPRRGGRLRGARRDARHVAAGLAPARPRRRLPAVPQGRSGVANYFSRPGLPRRRSSAARGGSQAPRSATGSASSPTRR